MDDQVKKANLAKTNSESNSKGRILQMFKVKHPLNKCLAS